MKTTPKIDVHSHIEIPEAIALLPEEQKYKSQYPPLGPESAAQQERLMKAIHDQLYDPARRVADMKEMGIDVTILSAVANFSYHLEGSLALEVTRVQNERIAAIVQKYPEQFVGMATVPLHNVEASVSELERAVLTLKLKGVEIGSNVGGRYLGDQIFWPFFQKVEALDIPIFIHPNNVAGADRLGDYYLINLVGNLLDTTITAAHLIMSGTLERFPGLKIILSHAGGYLPYSIGRLEHGFKVRPECRAALKQSPAEYLRRFYFDTISHNTDALRFLISKVGADRVVVGTDYPFDMGDLDPLRSVEAVPKLTAKEKAQISGGNAVSLFKL